MKKIFQCWLIGLLCLPVFAQDVEQFMHFDKANGLSDNNVDCLLQDSYGYLWVGTWNGLNRFDGYGFDSYSNSKNKSSLPGNWILCMFEDSDRTLWVGTNLGLAYFDRLHNCFARYGKIDFSVNSICQDRSHQLWLATNQGFYVIDQKSKNIVAQPSTRQELGIAQLRGMCVDGKGQILTASIRGIEPIMSQTMQRSTRFDKIINSYFPNKDVRAVAIDQTGTLWLGAHEAGILAIDTATLQARLYQHSASDNFTIGSNNVWSIFVDQSNTLWVGCENGCLNRFDRQNKRFVRYKGRHYDDRYLQTDAISALASDKLGSLWIGSHGNGVYCLSKEYNMFRVFEESQAQYNGLSSGKVVAFAELADRTIVLAKDGSGMQLYNPSNNTVSDFKNNAQLPSFNMHNLISHHGILWLAFWGGGVCKIEPNRGFKVTAYKHNEANDASLNCNDIKGLMATDTALWVGTHGDGVALFDFKSEQFFHQSHVGKLGFDPLLPRWINHIAKDCRGDVWISTFDGLFQLHNKQWRRFLNQADSDKSIVSNAVSSVFEDSKKQLWIVTQQGIDKYNESTNEFAHFGIEQGFPAKPIAMIEDALGQLWITASDGLYVYSEKDKHIRWFDAYSGIVGGDFKPNAAFRSSNGTLYFGSSVGFMVCRPENINKQMSKPPIVFKSLYVNYERQTIDSAISTKAVDMSDSLHFLASNDIISLEVSAIHLSLINQVSYSYLLEGLHEQWINLGKTRMITFSRLQPGVYNLRVKARINQGVESERTIKIIIQPRWWMSVWFKILLVVGIVFIVFMFFYIRTRRIRQTNEMLKQKIVEHTLDLQTANNSLEVQNLKLEEQYRLVATQKDELQQANDVKTKLFAIISHDLKNPLAALQGLSELLQNNFHSFSNEKRANLLKSIVNSSRMVSELTMNLLNWSVVQTNSIVANPQEIDIAGLVQASIAVQHEVADAKEISIDVQYEHQTLVLVDSMMISTVLRNILSNSIKFTPKHGHITIQTHETAEWVSVAIQDTGVGLQPEVIDRILHSNASTSTYGTNNEKGTGLGLNVSKDFLTINKARLLIESELGQGSCFTICLPKGTGSVSAEEKLPAVPVSLVVDQIIVPRNMVRDEETIICIVEDNDEIRSYLNNIFEPFYRTELASNGKQGLELIQAQIPDLIITDIEMPELSGLDMIAGLRKNAITNHIPMIVLSSRDLNEQMIEGYNAGADDYVTKPFSQAVLLHKVKAMLEQGERLRQHLKKQALLQPPSTTPTSNEEKFLKQVAEIVAQNYPDELFSVEVLAQHLGLSRVQLYRKFKTVIGQNPNDYIKLYRLEKATMMLKSGKWRVSDVCFEVGFSDPQYFSLCFTKQYGIPPSQY